MKKIKNKIYICPCCGPFNRVITEHFISGEGNLYKVDFIHHIDYVPYMVSRVKIHSAWGKKTFKTDFCAECGCLIETGKNHRKWTNKKNAIQKNTRSSELSSRNKRIRD